MLATIGGQLVSDNLDCNLQEGLPKRGSCFTDCMISLP